MGIRRYFIICCLLFSYTYCLALPVASDGADTSRFGLRRGWSIQSSAKVEAKGETVSTAQFVPRQWYPASVPTTVLNALVENNVYPDPYYGMNLRSIPGTAYPIGENFAKFPMPADSPFRVPWWRRSRL